VKPPAKSINYFLNKAERKHALDSKMKNKKKKGRSKDAKLLIHGKGLLTAHVSITCHSERCCAAKRPREKWGGGLTYEHHHPAWEIKRAKRKTLVNEFPKYKRAKKKITSGFTE